MPKLAFTLLDVETGFFETTKITGEGIDKGDKAGYKAYTGALKYFLANTFMVATGDDPEKESPDNRMNKKGKNSACKEYGAQEQSDDERKATAAQIAVLARTYTGEKLDKLLEANGVANLEDIPMKKASELITKLSQRGK